MSGTTVEHEDHQGDVVDVTSWLDRATSGRPAPRTDYVPKHRADGPAA